MRPRTAPHGGKPHTAPEHNHAVMPEVQQRKFLGVGEEHTLNLGHPSTQDRLTEHPLGKVHDYANSRASEKIVAGPKRSQSVYGKFADPKDGHDLKGYAGYAHAGTYQRGDGTGRPVSMRDPRGRRDEGSDGHLATPEWTGYTAGADSGVGRIEKTHLRK
jgi:hypothetical protein